MDKENRGFSIIAVTFGHLKQSNSISHYHWICGPLQLRSVPQSARAACQILPSRPAKTCEALIPPNMFKRSIFNLEQVLWQNADSETLPQCNRMQLASPLKVEVEELSLVLHEQWASWASLVCDFSSPVFKALDGWLRRGCSYTGSRNISGFRFCRPFNDSLNAEASNFSSASVWKSHLCLMLGIRQWSTWHYKDRSFSQTLETLWSHPFPFCT